MNQVNNRKQEELEKFRLKVLKLNNSVLTSVIKEEQLTHFISSIRPSALHMPDGWILKDSHFVNPTLKLEIPIIDITTRHRFNY